VNLYIPSALHWQERGARLALKTEYPLSEEIALELTELKRPQTFALALRIPAWCDKAALSVNGRTTTPMRVDGYAVLKRRWKSGDIVRLTLPMQQRVEPMADDPGQIAFLHGPLVLAADLGPADSAFAAVAPALVGTTIQPAHLTLKPFFQQYERRTALYFRKLTPAQWEMEQAAFLAEQERVRALDARALDVLYLGDGSSEAAHGVTGPSETILYRGRNSRLARKGGWFEFRMKCADEPLTLQAVYRGDERNRVFRILVDGAAIGAQRLDGDRGGVFFDQNYAIPIELTRGKRWIVVRFEADPDFGTGPVYECRVLPSVTTTAPTST
jgi:hypothetical protein